MKIKFNDEVLWETNSTAKEERLQLHDDRTFRFGFVVKKQEETNLFDVWI